jgi:hypothetical protein
MRVKQVFKKLLLIMTLTITLIMSASETALIMEEQFITKNAVLKKWKHIHFRGAVRLKMQAEKNAGNYAACFYAPEAGKTLDTFYTTIKKHVNCKKIKVSFQYKTASDTIPLLVAISKARGCNIPSIKKFPKMIRDNKWHNYTFIYDMTGFDRGQVDIEFLVEGKVKRGDKLLLDNIYVTEVNPSAYHISMNSPTSRCIIANTPSQNIIIDVHSHKKGKTFLLELNSGQRNLQTTQLKPFIGSRKVKFCLKSCKIGTYKIVAKADSKTVKTWNVTKYPYKKNSLLIHDRIPYYNGKPFFTIGIYHASDLVLNIINRENNCGVAKGQISRDKMFKELNERGFNVVHYSWTAAPKEFYKVAAKYGFLVLSESRNRLHLVEKVKDQPNIYGWYSFDEPPASHSKKCSGIFKKYKKIDPYHPVMTAFRSAGVGYGDDPLVDIAFGNRYPINSVDSDVSGISLYLTKCREVLNRKDPVTCEIAVPQLFTHDSSMYQGIEPSAKQLRAEVYTAVIAGSKGIFYYAYYTSEPLKKGMSLNSKRKHWFLPESKLWNYIGTLNQELISLKDVILMGKDVEGFNLTSFRSIPNKIVKYKQNYYWFIVNPSGKKQAETTLCWTKKIKNIKPLFKSKPLSFCSARKATLKLFPYEVAVYKLSQ